MANYTRNDPSSLSFGRRLSTNERETAINRKELEELKRSLPNSNQLTGAAMAADVIKKQKRAATQMIADSTSSLAALESIDPSILSPALQEQLRMNKQDAAAREQGTQPIQFNFDAAALQRFQNWAQFRKDNPVDVWSANNSQPEASTPYSAWAKSQDSPEGQMWRNQQMQREMHQVQVEAARQLELSRQQKPKGKNIGGVQGLN